MFWYALPRDGFGARAAQVVPLPIIEVLNVAYRFEPAWLHYQLWPRSAAYFFGTEGRHYTLLIASTVDSGTADHPLRTAAVWAAFNPTGRYGQLWELERSFYSLDGRLQFFPMVRGHNPLRLRIDTLVDLPAEEDQSGDNHSAARGAHRFREWCSYNADYIWGCSLLGPTEPPDGRSLAIVPG